MLVKLMSCKAIHKALLGSDFYNKHPSSERDFDAKMSVLVLVWMSTPNVDSFRLV